MAATNWMQTANAACENAVIEAQLRVWEGMRNGGG
jgi:hypothetical protein